MDWAGDSASVIAAARASPADSDAYWGAVAELWRRGGREELELALALIRNPAPQDRVLGADILGQLGARAPSFLDESVEALLALLGDADDAVVASAAVGLGHRHDPRALPGLLGLADHPNPDVRDGVVHGLLGYEEDAAVSALIRLSSDPVVSVRDWATFGLARQVEADTPALREALLARVEDPDPETAGEAMMGLAARGDRRAAPAIQDSLAGPFHGSWAAEAAALLGGEEFEAPLAALVERLDEDISDYLRRVVEEQLLLVREGRIPSP